MNLQGLGDKDGCVNGALQVEINFTVDSTLLFPLSTVARIIPFCFVHF
jgi:hypothetical protein